MKTLGIYVHIPFCVQKCNYCDFLSAPADDKTRARYVEVLCEEIKKEAVSYRDRQVDTVFFGGGTPSLLTGGQMRQIMNTLKENYHFQIGAECSMEMNPGTAGKDRLQEYYEAGINRLSIGLQSADDRELMMLGRIHTWNEFENCFASARQIGFENINIDIMSALPLQTIDSYKQTLERVLCKQPEHISAYSLMIEEGTRFFESHPSLPDEDMEREMYVMTGELLHEYGYERYEISNYAREGKECRHNIKYWTREAYAGFGLGASSMVDDVRWKNTDSLTEYLQKEEKREPESIKKLSVEEQMEEFMFLGLRMQKGISKKAFDTRFGKTIEQVYEKVLAGLYREKLLLEEGDRLYLSDYGIDVSNYVLAQFLL